MAVRAVRSCGDLATDRHRRSRWRPGSGVRRRRGIPVANGRRSGATGDESSTPTRPLLCRAPRSAKAPSSGSAPPVPAKPRRIAPTRQHLAQPVASNSPAVHDEGVVHAAASPPVWPVAILHGPDRRDYAPAASFPTSVDPRTGRALHIVRTKRPTRICRDPVLGTSL